VSTNWSEALINGVEGGGLECLSEKDATGSRQHGPRRLRLGPRPDRSNAEASTGAEKINDRWNSMVHSFCRALR